MQVFPAEALQFPVPLAWGTNLQCSHIHMSNLLIENDNNENQKEDGIEDANHFIYVLGIKDKNGKYLCNTYLHSAQKRDR